MTSVSQFVIIANFLLEFDYKEKIRKLIRNKDIIIFMLLFFSSVIWLLNSENLTYGLKDIQIKLPLLALPVIIGTSDALSEKRINIILLSFITSVFVSSFIGMLVYYNVILKAIDTDNIRNISVFVSHIRLSLMICLSIFVLGYWITKKIIRKKILIILSIIIMLWFVFYLGRSEVFTGLLSFIIILFLILLFKATKEKNKVKKVLYLLLGISVPLTTLIYSGIQINNFYTPTTVQNVSLYTAKGNKYYNDTCSFLLENGNYIYRDMSRKELFEEWSKRSDYDLKGMDKKGQYLYNSLIRYLTSKGLTKDSEGLAQLTDKDIRYIENGETNYKYAEQDGIEKRAYTIIWQIDAYFKTGDPSGHSITQRLEYQKVGLKLFFNNFWFGTGTGDLDDEFNKIYEETETPLNKEYWHRAHNQLLTFFICYGIFGGIIGLLAWFYPVIVNWDIKNYYFIIFFIIATLSMFSDDTLETSTGVAFVAFFYSLFLWGKK
jgi:hypothetical protein